MTAADLQGVRDYGWDHRDTVRLYRGFNARHLRYRIANLQLVRRAALAPGQSLLDYAAGTGLTAAAALPRLGRDGRIVCVEPAAAMRRCGQRALHDGRVRWQADLPAAEQRFERILCGAAIWQAPALAALLEQLLSRLTADGRLLFTIPAAYVGGSDDPGGGADPLLLQLPARLAEIAAPAADAAHRQPPAPPSAGQLQAALAGHAAAVRCWHFRMRQSQRAYADWLKIPVLTNRLLPGLGAARRVRVIESALASLDADSWRWENWTVWCAARPADISAAPLAGS